MRWQRDMWKFDVFGREDGWDASNYVDHGWRWFGMGQWSQEVGVKNFNEAQLIDFFYLHVKLGRSGRKDQEIVGNNGATAVDPSEHLRWGLDELTVQSQERFWNVSKLLKNTGAIQLFSFSLIWIVSAVGLLRAFDGVGTKRRTVESTIHGNWS